MDKQLEEQWQVIKETPAKQKRAEYLTYCELAIRAVEEGRLSIQEATYQICGISAQVMDQMLPGDKEIMDIACDLELPDAHRSRALDEWRTLVAKVRALRAQN